jgi:hypothetical protein
VDPVVAEAGKTLVRVMGTDGWSGARDAVVAWWGGHHRDEAGGVGADLDRLRGEVVDAGGDRETRDALAGEWQSRLRRLLVANPELAEGLRRLLVEQLAPLLAATGRVGGLTQSVTVIGDGNTTIQAGRDVSTSGERSISIHTGGGAFHGTAATGDHATVVNATGANIGAIGDNNTQVNHFGSPARPATEPGDGQPIS